MAVFFTVTGSPVVASAMPLEAAPVRVLGPDVRLVG